jgi:PAS domain S-box-containing protein
VNIDPTILFSLSIGYFLLVFVVAHAAEKQWIPAKLIQHPLTYTLSLGVFASAWALYGVVSLANEYGYGFLSYYLGIALLFFLASLLLIPLWRLCQTYMLKSLADVLAFRYRSQRAGSLVTLCMLVAVLPLLALQIQIISETALIITSKQATIGASSEQHDRLALIYCLVIALFAILFGAKQITPYQRHQGLVAAVAFDTLVKLTALLCVGYVSIEFIFGGLDGLSKWLEANPHYLDLLNSPIREDSSRTLLIIFFSAAVVMPHMFQMIIAENDSEKKLRTASWSIPTLLLLFSLPVLPILWGGYNTNTHLPPEYFSLSIGLDLGMPWLTLMTFLGGISGASIIIIVTTLALASMCLKHLILPFYRPSSDRDIHGWLILVRRALIVSIILCGYIFYRFMLNREALSNLGLAAFIATLQFFPGLFATLYWPRANSKGFIAGLTAGFSVWFITLLRPIVMETDPEIISRLYFTYAYQDLWHIVTLLSLGLNCAVFILFSLLTQTSKDEQQAAEACSTDDISRPARRMLSAQSAEEMETRLASSLGKRSAQREMERALEELNLERGERRPFALRKLRMQLETNLSSLLGPNVAREIIEQLLPYEEQGSEKSSDDINLIEGILENYPAVLSGLAADLDSLRRYHRQTLQELPVGVCSLGHDQEILMWNNAAEEITGIHSQNTIGAHLDNLPAPWNKLLADFLNSAKQRQLKHKVERAGDPLWVNLHKTNDPLSDRDGQVIVLEDATELQRLEHSLTHSERLASIGQLAAGVAHEIGNPITGIACLAQNLRYDTSNPESLATADEILTQTQRVTRIVQTLVHFAHTGNSDSKNHFTAVDIKACIKEAIHLLELNKDNKHISLHNLCQQDIYACGDQQRLLQVLINLINNARDASPANSRVEIDAYPKNDWIEITVTDHGCGISTEQQEKIFDPFFTTKQAGEGTGLGLYLVYNIIEDLEGHIFVQSPLSDGRQGTRFTLQLRSFTETEPTPGLVKAE